MARKKKISKRVKGYNIVLICVLSILLIAMSIVFVTMLFSSKPFYKIESRTKEIANNKKNDKEDYKTIGWVRVQGTNIDYPLYGINKTSKEYPVNESLLWDLSYDGTYHNVMQVYGHNVQNLGSNPIKHDETFIRMEELMSFVYFDFAKENKYFQITIDGKDYLYKIFAVDFIEVEAVDGYPKKEYSNFEKKLYIDEMKSNSIYDYDVDVTEKDDIATVITCTRFFGDRNQDFLVTGRLVRKNEKVDNYSVYRNKKYTEEIINVLEGEVDYEK